MNISLSDKPQFVCETRPQGVTERRDCTVRAFASAAGLDYGIVYQAFQAEGRKRNCGCYLKDVAQAVAKRLGLTLTMVRRSGSLARFLRDFPQGAFIIRVSNHALAVKDGAVHDSAPQSPSRIIKSAWRVSKS